MACEGGHSAGPGLRRGVDEARDELTPSAAPSHTRDECHMVQDGDAVLSRGRSGGGGPDEATGIAAHASANEGDHEARVPP